MNTESTTLFATNALRGPAKDERGPRFLRDPRLAVGRSRFRSGGGSLGGAAVSAVNESEVVAVLIRRGATAEEALAVLATLDLASVALDSRLAADAGRLEAPTRPSGISLGDRCCLALAQRLRRPALTADRSWAAAAGVVNAEIRLIR
jgi:ribonuclease VapC